MFCTAGIVKPGIFIIVSFLKDFINKFRINCKTNRIVIFDIFDIKYRFSWFISPIIRVFPFVILICIIKLIGIIGIIEIIRLVIIIRIWFVIVIRLIVLRFIPFVVIICVIILWIIIILRLLIIVILRLLVIIVIWFVILVKRLAFTSIVSVFHNNVAVVIFNNRFTIKNITVSFV